MKQAFLFLCALAVILAAAPVAAQTVIEKPPDLGDFWFPLSPNGGSYVYADCFVAPAGPDLTPAVLGTWLNDNNSELKDSQQTAPSVPNDPSLVPTVRFEIWGDLGPGLGPDAGNVIATTGSLAPVTNGVLTLITAPVMGSPAPLVPGDLYWFAATVVGEGGSGFFNTGGHTQNSVFNDNCTFWFSNDPAGINFDGQNVTPEMPFRVELLGGVPAIGKIGLVLLALALVAAAIIPLRRMF